MKEMNPTLGRQRWHIRKGEKKGHLHKWHYSTTQLRGAYQDHLFSSQQPPQMAMNMGTSTQTNFFRFFSFARAPNVHEKQSISLHSLEFNTIQQVKSI
jgi:hypothetical protein